AQSGGESRDILIGGWMGSGADLAPQCGASLDQSGCKLAKMADDPMQLAGGGGINVDGVRTSGTGPVIIEASVQRRCAADGQASLVTLCEYGVHGQQALWTGDGATTVGPITLFNLIAGMTAAIPVFKPIPLDEFP